MGEPAPSSINVELSEAVTAPRAHIDAFLAQALDDASMPARLDEATRYALLSPGKRARPLLTVHACIAAGGTVESALPAAAAVEMVHAFSLVHDDLPAMDDDDLRRGRPTAHIAFGEALAILAGDALLTLAFRVLSERAAPPDLSATLSHELSSATAAMINGQVRDTLGDTDGATDADRLERIHREKTGALITAAARMGVLCAPTTTPGRLDAITNYAGDIGLLFQIVDDLLDVEQTGEHLGKRSGKDAGAGKLTYPRVFGVAGSRERAEDLLARALATLDQGWAGPTDPLRELATFAARRTR